MRLFSKPKIKLGKKRSSYDNSVPSYEDVLLEVEKRRKAKTNKEKNGRFNSGS